MTYMTSDDSYEIFKEIIFLNHHHHGSNKNLWIIMHREFFHEKEIFDVISV